MTSELFIYMSLRTRNHSRIHSNTEIPSYKKKKTRVIHRKRVLREEEITSYILIGISIGCMIGVFIGLYVVGVVSRGF